MDYKYLVRLLYVLRGVDLKEKKTNEKIHLITRPKFGRGKGERGQMKFSKKKQVYFIFEAFPYI